MLKPTWDKTKLPSRHVTQGPGRAPHRSYYHAMGITEVVRGADLLKSTARQILLNRALGYKDPAWFHTKLVVDHNGRRLAKRYDALSLRALRQRGITPMNILAAELPVEV